MESYYFELIMIKKIVVYSSSHMFEVNLIGI